MRRAPSSPHVPGRRTPPPRHLSSSSVPPGDRSSTVSDANREIIAEGVYGAVTLGTDDLDGLFERLDAAGADIVQEPTEQDYGVRDCALRDPSGNLIRANQL
ncbi:hypothetical protein G6021_02680 [Dietzia sp. CW19]|nr:VOC family protein [Dietzia sp. CW19]MBB1050042.1 hypothetical protein [Dietzia sp. CW19]